MIIVCSSCGSRYKYDENRLAGAASKRVKCPKCKGIIDVFNPNLSTGKPSDLDHTYDSGTSRRSSMKPGGAGRGPSTVQVKRDSLIAEAATAEDPMPPMKMPENRRYSLAVISGNNSGEIFHINKPHVTVGRADADIVVRDVEASRSHARVEVMGERVILRDLNSTNGTFVDERRISAVNLENQSEFRIGTTIFMLIITDID